MSKRIDFLGNKKIDYIELSNEIKAEVGILNGLDMYTYAHVLGVTDTTFKICEEMKMPYDELKDCVLGAYLHDVGKIYIPTEILQKESTLTDDEYVMMKTHTILGYETCMEYKEEYRHLAKIARWHHESFDGSRIS